MENHNNTSFSIEKKKVVLVKPSKTTPSSHALSLSTIDNDLSLRVLYRTIYVYKSNNIFSTTQDHHDRERKTDNKQTDPASLIEKALSDVLVFYYPLAGMMKRQSDGKLQINCNAIGVPFLVANADCQLSFLDYLDGIEVDVKTARKFLFDFPSDPNEGEHPLVVQVTKFACGGFTIGMGLSHSICDGSGAAQFFQAMAELASGKSEPSIKPVWERQKLVAKAPPGPPKFFVDPASLATSPFLPTDDILHACFNVNAESIKRLRMDLIKECEGDHVHQTDQGNFYLTTFEVLTAYVWRSRFRAMKLSPDAKTLICLTMNIRRRLNPPLPDGYYGNAFINANAVLTGKDLNEKPLSETAKVIKECKKSSSTNEYINTTLELSERMRELNVMCVGIALELTDCRQIGLIEDIDFGWGGPVNLVLVPCDNVDLCLFWPPNNVDPSMKGGVRVHVTLPRAAMPKFKEEMDALKVQEDHNDNALCA
ncbi:hypothetical protein LWI28_020993 [Acer negundo]|uniref:Uncharacterized protein n=1 Tax=Acer negundo TaxID=4023 RepID=A0AAD5IGE8_ACENE|nr:hypothetical protein LWI28_020993 [Acer negundo]KAK4837485.1 hypothetical protein QYF36_005895 [Acer negundo]